MPTRATRKGCGGRIMINRPCRPNRRSRLFNRKKLTQIIIRTCEEWGTYDVQAAIEDALAQGCDNEERKKKQQQEEDKARELKAEIDLAWAKVAALLAALALLACLSDEDREKIEEVTVEAENALAPVTSGQVFMEGGGYGGGGTMTGGVLTSDGLAAIMLQMCDDSGPDAVRSAVIRAMADCNETAYPQMCAAIRNAKSVVIDTIDAIKPLLRFADNVLMLLANVGAISSDEWTKTILGVHSLASGDWEQSFNAIALELGCGNMPQAEPFGTGDGF